MNEQIALIIERLQNLVIVGAVVAIDFNTAKVKVSFDENQKTVWLPWAEKLAGQNHTWTPLEIGVQVIVLSVNGNLERGIIIGCLNQNSHSQISTNGAVQKVNFKDGTSIINNSDTNTLTISSTGTVDISASSVNINSGIVNITGGTINIAGGAGDVVVSGISLVNHTHTDTPGLIAGTTSPPIK